MTEMGTVHRVKCWPEYYRLMIGGAKPFDVRLDDRGYQAGQPIWQDEWDPVTEKYTGRETLFRITYVLSLGTVPKLGALLSPEASRYVVLGLQRVTYTREEITE